MPRGGILLAHAAAERKEKLYKKTLPQQELGFFIVFFFFPPFAHFFAFVASPRKGKKIKGEKKKGKAACRKEELFKKLFSACQFVPWISQSW